MKTARGVAKFAKRTFFYRETPNSNYCRCALTGIVALIGLYSSQSLAQISLVKTIVSNKSTGTLISITPPASGIAAGHSGIILFASDPITALSRFSAFTRVTGDGFYIDNERGKVQVTIRTEGQFTRLTIFKNDIPVLQRKKPDWRSVEIEKTVNDYFSQDDVAAGCRVRVHYILPVPLKLELLCN